LGGDRHGHRSRGVDLEEGTHIQGRKKCLRKALEVIEAGKAPGPPVDAATSILEALDDKLEKPDVRKVVLRADHVGTGSASPPLSK
jgi:hypothetical protein